MRTHLPPNARLVPEAATRVFEGIIFDVYQWPQQLYDGTSTTFEMLKRPDTMVMLAIRDGKIVVVEETQPNGPTTFGLPSGRHDQPDEDETQAAAREMREETGLTFNSWQLISCTQKEEKIEHFAYFFLATDFAGEVEHQADAGERIIVHYCDFDEFKELIASPRARHRKPTLTEGCYNLHDLLTKLETQAVGQKTRL